ncbi:MAG: hypothetical protein M3083_01050 [Actinomycetota bacterium]|nr:hypothetical protein [Actinomycetota bacterium]
MTRTDDTGAVWMLREIWGVPAELAGNISDEENLEYGKALLIAAKGDGQLTDAERDWTLGYAICAGNSAENIQTLRSYAGDDDFEDLFTRGIQQIARRVCICDAIRACGSDGDLAPGELAAVHRMGKRLSVPSEVVDEFVEIYNEEQALKARRIKLAFPDGHGG